MKLNAKTRLQPQYHVLTMWVPKLELCGVDLIVRQVSSSLDATCKRITVNTTTWFKLQVQSPLHCIHVHICISCTFLNLTMVVLGELCGILRSCMKCGFPPPPFPPSWSVVFPLPLPPFLSLPHLVMTCTTTAAALSCGMTFIFMRQQRNATNFISWPVP